MQARMHGLPSTSPSGLNNIEPQNQFVKQENSPDELHHQRPPPHQPPHLHSQPPQLHPQQLHPQQLHPQASQLHPQQPLQYSAVGSTQPFNFSHSLDLCDGGMAGYADGMGCLGDLGSIGGTVGGTMVHAGKKSDMAWMDEALSPLGTDPLLSAMSPEASVDSSRRSSFSIDDSDIL